MKDQYIKQVLKNLHISKKAKSEVMRDLNEIFDSALENGETEQQIINRLGTPKEFADNLSEQPENKSNFKLIISIAAAICIAVIAFVLYGITQAGTTPKDAIGQANAMTNIQVEGFGIDMHFIILVIGIVAIIFAVFQSIRTIVKNRGQL